MGSTTEPGSRYHARRRKACRQCKPQDRSGTGGGECTAFAGRFSRRIGARQRMGLKDMDSRQECIPFPLYGNGVLVC